MNVQLAVNSQDLYHFTFGLTN